MHEAARRVPGAQHHHRARFLEPGQVQDVAVLPELEVRVAVAQVLGRRRQHQRRVRPDPPHQLARAVRRTAVEAMSGTVNRDGRDGHRCNSNLVYSTRDERSRNRRGEPARRRPHRRRPPLGVPPRRRARPRTRRQRRRPVAGACPRRPGQAAGRRHLGRAARAWRCAWSRAQASPSRPTWPRWSRSAWPRRWRAASALALDRDAYRVVHAESDLLPGLVVDRYADAAVMQTTSVAMNAARDGDRRRWCASCSDARIVVARDDGSARDFEELPRFAGVRRGRRRHARRLPPGAEPAGGRPAARRQDRRLPRPGRQPRGGGGAGARRARARWTPSRTTAASRWRWRAARRRGARHRRERRRRRARRRQRAPQRAGQPATSARQRLRPAARVRGDAASASTSSCWIRPALAKRGGDRRRPRDGRARLQGARAARRAADTRRRAAGRLLVLGARDARALGRDLRRRARRRGPRRAGARSRRRRPRPPRAGRRPRDRPPQGLDVPECSEPRGFRTPREPGGSQPASAARRRRARRAGKTRSARPFCLPGRRTRA